MCVCVCARASRRRRVRLASSKTFNYCSALFTANTRFPRYASAMEHVNRKVLDGRALISAITSEKIDRTIRGSWSSIRIQATVWLTPKLTRDFLVHMDAERFIKIRPQLFELSPSKTYADQSVSIELSKLLQIISLNNNNNIVIVIIIMPRPYGYGALSDDAGLTSDVCLSDVCRVHRA